MGKAPLHPPSWVDGGQLGTGGNRTDMTQGQPEIDVRAQRRDPTAFFRSSRLPHGNQSHVAALLAAATAPAALESQTLQACHFYLRRFPISRATAFRNCLLRGEQAKFGELTLTRARAGFGIQTPESPPRVCVSP